MIHVFIGTKAQYIKMAPLLWRMDTEGVEYRLIDSGQHAALSSEFRAELGIREPDCHLGGTRDVTSVLAAMRWSVRLAVRLTSRQRLLAEVFGGAGGVCVVHGDTPTTLLSALMAKRAGLTLAQVEAGLRTHSWLHPFPEELIRVWVGRLSDLLFAPDETAAEELRRSKVGGRIVCCSANTVAETLEAALSANSIETEGAEAPDGSVETEGLDAPAGSVDDTSEGTARTAKSQAPAVVTMHRFENLYNRRRRDALCDALVSDDCLSAAPGGIHWYLHGPTQRVLKDAQRARLLQAGVELADLSRHQEFVKALAEAPFVITDGGSIQEECALLGVPTLLWRRRTDRRDGIGRNVILSRYEPAVVSQFLANPQCHRTEPSLSAVQPSAEILEALLAR